VPHANGDQKSAVTTQATATGSRPDAGEITPDIRQRTTHEGEETARAGLHAATQRDQIAVARDLAAGARDNAAAARDDAMSRSDAVSQSSASRENPGADALVRAGEDRRRGTAHRALAAEDRRAAAGDREQAAEQRVRSLSDRATFEAKLRLAETDPLTGARTRSAGLTDLNHEIDRCRRNNNTLVVAYVDVVGLKELNDTLGHQAGDELLRDVAALLSSHLRSYDLIVRLGGDEFLCAASDVSEAEIRTRFSAIASKLAATPDARGIRTGFATLRADETADAWIGRADAELIRLPRRRTG
jgi:diguanylate cyclase (GGDEF)-like protein